jgi:hypothetical protein
MKSITILFITFIIYTSPINAQTEWLIQDGTGLFCVITTETIRNSIIGHTRKGALKDYAGKFKFRVAKTLTSLKYPEIIYFKGVFTDSTRVRFTGTYHRLTSERKMEGIISGDSISLKLLNNGKIEVIKGIKRSSATASKDYASIVKKIINLTEEKIYDPQIVHSKKWKGFKASMTDNSKNINDDLELLVGSFAITRSFPFSHYSLTRRSGNQGKTSPNFSLQEIAEGTCVLDINAFHGSERSMDSLLQVISAEQYKNLIIDLRDNAGGDAESAIPLMSFLSSKETIVGVFPNNKWYREYSRIPQHNDYKKFNEFTSGTLNKFYSLAEDGYGVYIRIIPSKKPFSGKVFVLINKNTGSTSEVVALALRENKLAVLVGQKTAGGVLSAKKFNIDDKFDLTIPQNDYVSYASYRIDNNGVRPDFTIKEDGIEYVLKLLFKSDTQK